MEELISTDVIERKILLIRGQKVMLDADLAELYGVPTKRLNEQVKRNTDRFPADFVFQLTYAEWASLKSQFATASGGVPSHGDVVNYPGVSPRKACHRRGRRECGPTW